MFLGELRIWNLQTFAVYTKFFNENDLKKDNLKTFRSHTSHKPLLGLTAGTVTGEDVVFTFYYLENLSMDFDFPLKAIVAKPIDTHRKLCGSTIILS